MARDGVGWGGVNGWGRMIEQGWDGTDGWDEMGWHDLNWSGMKRHGGELHWMEWMGRHGWKRRHGRGGMGRKRENRVGGSRMEQTV